MYKKEESKPNKVRNPNDVKEMKKKCAVCILRKRPFNQHALVIEECIDPFAKYLSHLHPATIAMHTAERLNEQRY